MVDYGFSTFSNDIRVGEVDVLIVSILVLGMSLMDISDAAALVLEITDSVSLSWMLLFVF